MVIGIRCRLGPHAGPAGPRFGWGERLSGLRRTGDVLLLFALVMRGLLWGSFTPTEAGAMGLRRPRDRRLSGRLTLRVVRDAVYETLKTTGMIFGILFGALVFDGSPR